MLLLCKLLTLKLLLAAICVDHQTYPGTSTRPVLSDTEAAQYTKENYLQGWIPEKVNTSGYDYLVGSDGYGTIQEAVNAAINDGGTTRKYIKITAGTYKEAVLIPKTNVSLTLYGTPGYPGDVQIILSQGANMTGAEYANQVNPNGTRYKKGDPAYFMYISCARRLFISTACSSVFVGLSDNLEVAYLTIENPSTDLQSVALTASGGKQQYESIWLYGFQDTLYAKSGTLYFVNSTIKGDIDFIFGDGSAVFDSATIIARGDRPRNTSIVFAPSTPRGQKFGFLVVKSTITADGGVALTKGCKLAREWLSDDVNGQLVIRETEILEVIDVTAPYAPSTGNNQPFTGNVNTNRSLDDPDYNRFWEYKNYGAGA